MDAGLPPRNVELATVWNIRIAGVNLAGLSTRSSHYRQSTAPQLTGGVARSKSGMGNGWSPVGGWASPLPVGGGLNMGEEMVSNSSKSETLDSVHWSGKLHVWPIDSLPTRRICVNLGNAFLEDWNGHVHRVITRPPWRRSCPTNIHTLCLVVICIC